MKSVGIIGGGGFAAGELIRLLINHPDVKLEYVMSESQTGKPVHAVHQDLAGETNLIFQKEFSQDVDVLFICKGHGQAKTFLEQHKIREDLILIDLSRDYRLKSEDHNFIYGLPELDKDAISSSNQIANPGCFATAIQLALLPLAKNNSLTNEIHIHGITGATGAGQAKLDTTHFSWRNNNVSVYKAFNHQHLTEVNQTIDQCQQSIPPINFIPVRGDFTRGIFISLYTKTDLSEKALKHLYQMTYEQTAFTHHVHEAVHLKQVVNTNKCLVQAVKHGEHAFIISAIDNLLKGASGQAVQNMNIRLGIDEHAGLRLKAMAY